MNHVSATYTLHYGDGIRNPASQGWKRPIVKVIQYMKDLMYFK